MSCWALINTLRKYRFVLQKNGAQAFAISSFLVRSVLSFWISSSPKGICIYLLCLCVDWSKSDTHIPSLYRRSSSKSIRSYKTGSGGKMPSPATFAPYKFLGLSLQFWNFRKRTMISSFFSKNRHHSRSKFRARLPDLGTKYAVASINRMLKNIGLFCKRALQMIRCMYISKK